jgi:hypothetical protein
MMYLKATDEMLGSTRRLIESSSQVLKCYGWEHYTQTCGVGYRASYLHFSSSLV